MWIINIIKSSLFRFWAVNPSRKTKFTVNELLDEHKVFLSNIHILEDLLWFTNTGTLSHLNKEEKR
jgi:hypothetical protein